MSRYLSAFLERVQDVGGLPEIQEDARAKTAKTAKIGEGTNETAPKSSFGNNGNFGTGVISENLSPDLDLKSNGPDDFEERAAIVEYEAGVPRAWAEGFARLDCTRPPGDVPPARWRRFIDDCGLFLDSGWAEKAAALGWGPLDLFGCNAVKPWARIDQAGLLWLLNGSRLVALATDRAVVETVTDVRQTYRPRNQTGADCALAWEIN